MKTALKNLIAIVLTGSLLPIGYAQVKEVMPTNGLCKKAVALSQGSPVSIGTEYSVPASSIKLIRASEGYDGYSCHVTVDTAKGPKGCKGGLYTDGKGVYWVDVVGGLCQ
jgi:hypothetical protein